MAQTGGVNRTGGATAMSDTENPQPAVQQDASQAEVREQPRRKARRGWFAEFMIYLMLIVAGALLAIASAYLMRKFGL
jgi:cell division protein FtsL